MPDMTEYILTKKKLREAFELMPVDTRLTFFVSLCYTITLINSKEKTGAEIYDEAWERFYQLMSTLGLVDIIRPLVEALNQEEGTLQ